MKLIVGISLFIAWAVFITILIAGLLFNQSSQSESAGSMSQVMKNTSLTVFAVSEVAKHGSSNDCWVIVNNKIYDLTNFLGSHSGGAREIIPFCGKDGSNAYSTKNGQGSHRSADVNILQQFYIGDLDNSS